MNAFSSAKPEKKGRVESEEERRTEGYVQRQHSKRRVVRWLRVVACSFATHSPEVAWQVRGAQARQGRLVVAEQAAHNARHALKPGRR